MKSAALFTMAAATYYSTSSASAGAISLRRSEGNGIEEVGDQIEFFVEEEVLVDRHRLLADAVSTTTNESDIVAAQRVMEESVSAAQESAAVAEEYANVDIVGNVIDDPISNTGLYYWDEDDIPINKEYAPDPNSILLEGSDLLGGSESSTSYTTLEEYDHRHATSTTCSSNEGSVMVVLKTDHYGYETSWKILDGSNYAVAKGPPSNTRYADDMNYSGRWCLPSGTYKVVVNDKSGDGMCKGDPDVYGCGFFKVYLNGEQSGQIVSVKDGWSNKVFTLNVAPVSSRIDGTTSSSGSGGSSSSSGSDNWCTKVKSVMKVPQGTCTLPSGARGHRVRVTTKVDKYGEETSWKITKSNGSVVMKMGAIVPANSVKAIEDCLPPGDYNLSFSDLDGVCCKNGQGYYNLIVDGQEVLEGGAFISSINHDFKLGYDWIDDMTERDCEWWWAHDYRRRDWHTRCYNGQYCNKSYRHLRWNASLKADAIDYANRLLSTCNEEGIHHDASSYGENLAKNKGSGAWGQLYPADRITKRFVDNEEFWGWNDNAHLTQSMWYASRYIGCGESVKTMSNGETCRFQVCRYSKPGNCVMESYSASVGNNWMKPMMMDDSPCKPLCPESGCHL